MSNPSKETILKKAVEHVGHARKEIEREIAKTQVSINTKVSAAKIEDKWANEDVKAMRENRLEQLKLMNGSPYFNKCECIFDGQAKTYYFGKFSFPEQNIYSWVAPAATIRFEAPGNISYKIPHRKDRSGELLQKDQYMIVDGNILFFAREEKGKGRELIHQEHLSTRKQGFMLPEIVSVMEKAQDMIIRAHHKGSFAISGPAGSGKTTLALHRAAYLIQSPDTSEHYPSEKVIVFVQDAGAKEYFSHLLPELGIHHVEITTFFEWASKILELEGIQCVAEYEPAETEKHLYAFRKIQTLRSADIPTWNKNIFSVLQKYYEAHFDKESLKAFASQKKENILDRIDITILLQSHLNKKGKFELIRTFTRALHSGSRTNKTEKKLLKYPLMVIDEFQNYMPEQINIMKACLEKETESVIYVGDMAQQVRLGTIKSWQDINERLSDERNIRLHKVYRNTKQILNYINSLGFNVEIPEGLKEGPEVKNLSLAQDEVISHLKNLVGSLEENQTLGIIGKEKRNLEHLKEIFKENQQVHICTMIESQGVEFDTVCLINPHKETTQTFTNEEVQKIEKDLLYVALTRAINEMHVLESK